MSLVVFEFPRVNASVPILKTGTLTSHLIVKKATYVFRAIRPRVSTEASLLIVYPSTVVFVLALVLLPRHFAISGPFVVSPVSDINASICEHELSLTRLHAILPVAVVRTSFSPGKFSLSTKQVIHEIAFIFATIAKRVCAITVSLII